MRIIEKCVYRGDQLSVRAAFLITSTKNSIIGFDCFEISFSKWNGSNFKPAPLSVRPLLIKESQLTSMAAPEGLEPSLTRINSPSL